MKGLEQANEPMKKTYADVTKSICETLEGLHKNILTKGTKELEMA